MTDRPSADRLVIGIDIGGTKIAAGLVNVDRGTILSRAQRPTPMGEVAILTDIAALVRQMQGIGHQTAGIGIGICELVDRAGKLASRSLAHWSDLALCGLDLGLPVSLVADVRAAALAELRFGAARGVTDALYVSIGSGISSCLILNGQPYAGAHGAALVLTSAVLPRTCLTCATTSQVSVEAIASGHGIERAFDPTRAVSAAEILRRAATNDPKAVGILDSAATEAGTAIGPLSNCTDPALIIIGGGLGTARGPYCNRLIPAIHAARWSGMPKGLRITRALFGPDAGIVGAAVAQAEGVQ